MEIGLAPEHLDRADLAPQARREALRDLRRVNRLLFGRTAAVRAVLRELADARHRGLPHRGKVAVAPMDTATAAGVAAPPPPPAEPAGAARRRLLDVAAGAGDVGAAVRRSAARRGVPLDVVALDRELQHLLLGRRWGDVERAVVARAEALPFADGSFDIALSTLFFHHLDWEGKAAVAAEMLRVCRRAALIVDLRRSRWAGAAVRVLFPLLGIGRLAREDGLVSIARASSPAEWRRFLAAADPARRGAELERRFPARISIVLRPPTATASATPAR